MTMVVDSGASDHYVDDKLDKDIKQLMFDYQEFDTPRTITTAGLHTLLGTATGKVRSKVTDSNGRTRKATLPITIVPGIGRNRFSSGAAQSITTTIFHNGRLERGNVNFPQRRDGQLFTLDLELWPSTPTQSPPIATNKADTRHRHLGHLDESSMKTLRDQPDSGVSFEGNISPCKTCALGKSAQGKHPKTSTVTTTTPFELVYTDLAGSFKQNELDGLQYISRFTDHHTRRKAVYPIRSKDKTIDTLSYLTTSYLLGLRMQRLRCDKGGEYTAGCFRDFCKQTDIEQEFAATNTPQQKGMYERDGRTIMNMVRCILIDTSMPKFLWGEICETVTYITNRSAHRELGGRSPNSQWYNMNTDLSSLRIVGARAFAHKEMHVHKLEQKAWEGLMIGYGKDSRSYRIYNPKTRRITGSRNGTFIETLPEALPPAGQEKLLETNEELFKKKNLITGTFLGIYHYIFHWAKIKTQQGILWHHPPHLTRRNVQLAQEVHQDHRDPIQRAHPVQQDNHPTRPAARPYQLVHPLLKGQRHNQLLH